MWVKQIKHGVHLWEEHLTDERPFLDAVQFLEISYFNLILFVNYILVMAL